MKYTILVVFLLLVQTVSGQVRKGTYHITGNVESFGGGRLFSGLIIKSGHRFTYEFRTSTSCFLWHDIKGSWKTKTDTLILKDRVRINHPVLSFRNQTTDDRRIAVSAETRLGLPVTGVKILYIFKDTKDTLSGFTNAEGVFVIDPKGRIKVPSEDIGKYRSSDDVEIWAVYFNEKGKELRTNTFSDLSAKITLVIEEDAKDEYVNRTTAFKIEKKQLVNISQYFENKGTAPLFGNFEFGKEE